MTVISCSPSYRKTSVNLTISFDGVRPVEIVRVDPINGDGEEIESLSLRSLHSNLPLARTQDTSGALDADSFGMMVHAYAQKLSPGTEVDPDAMLIATERLYSTFFAGLAMEQLMQPPAEPLDLNGVSITDITKLFTSEAVAGVLAGLLFFMLLSTIAILVHVETRESCLQEEPKGLIPWLMTLSDTELIQFVSTFKSDHPGVERPGEYIKDHYSVDDARCWYEHSEGATHGCVVVKDLVELLPPKEKWHWLKAVFDISRKKQEPLADRADPVELKPPKVMVNEVKSAAERH